MKKAQAYWRGYNDCRLCLEEKWCILNIKNCWRKNMNWFLSVDINCVTYCPIEFKMYFICTWTVPIFYRNKFSLNFFFTCVLHQQILYHMRNSSHLKYSWLATFSLISIWQLNDPHETLGIWFEEFLIWIF